MIPFPGYRRPGTGGGLCHQPSTNTFQQRKFHLQILAAGGNHIHNIKSTGQKCSFQTRQAGDSAVTAATGISVTNRRNPALFDGKLGRDICRKRSSENGCEAGPAIPVEESPHTLAQISKINRCGKNQNIGSFDFFHY